MEPELTTTIAMLARTPTVLRGLVWDLPAEMIRANEGEGTWTVTQVLAHLIHGERTDWLPRVRILLRAGVSEVFPAFVREAATGEGRSLPQLLGEFSTLRTQGLAELEALHLTAEDLERRGRHPVFGVVTLSELLSTWAVHDLTHLHQISRILAGQYREAVGPWRRYLGVMQCDGHSEKA